jgi:hypothetical protein
MYVCL